jgi:nucleotide-binding universal stress UspA family protein
MTDPIVLVPLDGSKDEPGVLPVAKRLADLHQVPLQLLQATDQAGGGNPADAIIKAADDRGACLIVIRPELEPTGEIGAATLKVLHDVSCPVVLVGPAMPPQDDWALRRVLAPHDGSPSISLALRPAVELARRAGAELVVLQAAGARHATESGSIAPLVYVDQAHHTWPVWTGEFLQRLGSLCPLEEVQVRLLVGGGELAAEAVRLAGEESVDLIALAWRTDGEPRESLEAVLRDAPCPILVTRAVAA